MTDDTTFRIAAGVLGLSFLIPVLFVFAPRKTQHGVGDWLADKVYRYPRFFFYFQFVSWGAARNWNADVRSLRSAKKMSLATKFIYSGMFLIGLIFLLGAVLPNKTNPNDATVTSTPTSFGPYDGNSFGYRIPDDGKSLAILRDGNVVRKLLVSDIPVFDSDQIIMDENGLYEGATPSYAFASYSTSPLYDPKRNAVYFVVIDVGLSGAHGGPAALFSYSLDSDAIKMLVYRGWTGGTFADLYLSPLGTYLIFGDGGSSSVCSFDYWLEVYDLNKQKVVASIESSSGHQGIDEGESTTFEDWLTDTSFRYTDAWISCLDGNINEATSASSTKVFSIE